MSIYQQFLRWRRSRGYGIHSPLAFRLVQRVIRPSRTVRYYGYDRLEELARESEASSKMLKRAKLLLRFTAEIQPAYVWVSPKLPDLLMEAIRLAGGVIRIYDAASYPGELDRADLVVLYNHKLQGRELEKVLTGLKPMIAFNQRPAFIDRVGSALKNHIMLEGVESLIIAGNQGVTPVKYSISAF